MATVLIAAGSMVLYIIAYRTYGRYLASRIFRIDPDGTPPPTQHNACAFCILTPCATAL